MNLRLDIKILKLWPKLVDHYNGVSFVAKNAGCMLLSDQLVAQKLCSTFKSSFVSMAFKNNNNIALAVVQPS